MWLARSNIFFGPWTRSVARQSVCPIRKEPFIDVAPCDFLFRLSVHAIRYSRTVPLTMDILCPKMPLKLHPCHASRYIVKMQPTHATL